MRGEVGGCEGVGGGLRGAGVAVDPRRGKISYWELGNLGVVGSLHCEFLRQRFVAEGFADTRHI